MKDSRLFDVGTIPWAIITHIAVVDVAHQLQQTRAGMATGAGFGVYAVTLLFSDGTATRARCGKAIVLGPNDIGYVGIELDPVLGLDLARDALEKTVAAGAARGIPIKTVSNGAESFAFVMEQITGGKPATDPTSRGE